MERERWTAEREKFRENQKLTDRAAGRLRWLQHGRLHLYVLYIAVTLLVLLVWKLGVGR